MLIRIKEDEVRKNCRYCKKKYKACDCTEYMALIERNNHNPQKRAFRILKIWDLLRLFPHEQREEVILFYSNCTKRNMVDYKVHLNHGGKHDITNLCYITNREYREKHG